MHKRIGQLLGYADEQINSFLNSLEGGFNHLPDYNYPMELPHSLASLPRRKGFEPHESRIWITRPQTSNSFRIFG